MGTTIPTEGWIYILTNPNYKSIKIGKTTRTVEERAKELSRATGVPEPFVIFYRRFFQDCHQAEVDIHAYLDAERVKGADREFFSTPTFIAVQVVDRFYYEEKFDTCDYLIDNQQEEIGILQEEIGTLNETIENQQINIDNLSKIIEDQLEEKNLQYLGMQKKYWLENLIYQNVFQSRHWWKNNINDKQIRTIINELFNKQEYYENRFSEILTSPDFIERDKWLNEKFINNFMVKNEYPHFIDEVKIEDIMNNILKNYYTCSSVKMWKNPQLNIFEEFQETYFIILMMRIH